MKDTLKNFGRKTLRALRGERAFVALSSDTDCDGTTFCARRIVARTIGQACDRVGSYYCTSDVMTERAFTRGEVFRALQPSEQTYYRNAGYCSLGARWNPWVYDDTIGIPALDSRYDY